MSNYISLRRQFKKVSTRLKIGDLHSVGGVCETGQLEMYMGVKQKY